MRSARTDGTQKPIVDALRKVGCLVRILGGEVDLLVWDAHSRQFFYMDAKTPKAKQTETQIKRSAEGWPIFYPTSAEEAVAHVDHARRRVQLSLRLIP